MKRNKAGLVISLVLVVLLALIAIIGPKYLPHQPFKPDMRAALKPHSYEHLLGTDNLRRCVAC